MVVGYESCLFDKSWKICRVSSLGWGGCSLVCMSFSIMDLASECLNLSRVRFLMLVLELKA